MRLAYPARLQGAGGYRLASGSRGPLWAGRDRPVNAAILVLAPDSVEASDGVSTDRTVGKDRLRADEPFAMAALTTPPRRANLSA